MIKVDKGYIEIRGNVQDVLANLSTLVHNLYHDCFIGSAEISPEESRKMIMEAVGVGFLSDEEAAENAKESKERAKEDLLRMLDELADILKGKDDE